MQELIDKMASKVGIDKATAEKVVAFLQEHSTEVLGYLQKSGVADKLPGGVGDKLGKLF